MVQIQYTLVDGCYAGLVDEVHERYVHGQIATNWVIHCIYIGYLYAYKIELCSANTLSLPRKYPRKARKLR